MADEQPKPVIDPVVAPFGRLGELAEKDEKSRSDDDTVVARITKGISLSGVCCSVVRASPIPHPVLSY